MKFEDEFGGLYNQKLELEELSIFKITKQEFENIWNENE